MIFSECEREISESSIVYMSIPKFLSLLLKGVRKRRTIFNVKPLPASAWEFFLWIDTFEIALLFTILSTFYNLRSNATFAENITYSQHQDFEKNRDESKKILTYPKPSATLCIGSFRTSILIRVEKRNFFLISLFSTHRFFIQHIRGYTRDLLWKRLAVIPKKRIPEKTVKFCLPIRDTLLYPKAAFRSGFSLPWDGETVYDICLRARVAISATKSCRALAMTGKIASTEGFVVGSNSTLPLLNSARCIRNSSSQEGATVRTPSKSIWIGTSEFSWGRIALNASNPKGRDIKILPNFLS